MSEPITVFEPPLSFGAAAVNAASFSPASLKRALQRAAVHDASDTADSEGSAAQAVSIDSFLPSFRELLPRYGATGWVSAGKDVLHVFGGCDVSGSPTASIQRLNIVSGSVQHVSSVKGPSARFLHATVCDPLHRGKTITHGGCGTALVLDDMWEWDRESWKQLACVGEGPGRRHSHQLAATSDGKYLVVVGGTRSMPSLAFVDDMTREAPVAANNSSPLGTTRRQTAKKDVNDSSCSVCLYDRSSLVWLPVDMSSIPPSLVGRRHFSIVNASTPLALEPPALMPRSPGSIGPPGRRLSSVDLAQTPDTPTSQQLHSLHSGSFASVQHCMSQEFDAVSNDLATPTSHASNWNGTRCSVPGGTSFVVGPGVRSGDELVVLHVTQYGELIVGDHGLPGVEQPTVEMSRIRGHRTHDSEHPRMLVANEDIVARDKRLLPEPCRKAGRTILSFATPSPVSGGELVQLIEFGGKFEFDVPVPTPPAAKKRTMASLLDRGMSCRRENTEVSSPPGTPQSPKGQASQAHAIIRPILLSTSQTSAVTKLLAPVESRSASIQGSLPTSAAAIASISVPNIVTDPHALFLILSQYEGCAVVDLPSSVFIFGGRNAVDNTVSKVVYLVNKQSFTDFLCDGGAAVAAERVSAAAGSGGGSSKRLSTRFQAIVATMGSMRRRSTIANPKAAKTSHPAELYRESTLVQAMKTAKDMEEKKIAVLCKEVVGQLVASGEVADTAKEIESASQRVRVLCTQVSSPTRYDQRSSSVTDSRSRSNRVRSVYPMEDAADNAQDVHAQYDCVVEELRKVGLASPIVADESVVACETAFYLRQTLVHQSKLRKSAASEGASKYSEWFHPPVVTRAEAAARQKLAEATTGAPTPPSATRRGCTQRCRHPAASLPLSCVQTAREKQFYIEQRRLSPEGSTATLARPMSAVSSSRRRGRDAAPWTRVSSFPQQRNVTAEAKMKVNAPCRRTECLFL